jgi:hypothetical protein
LRISKVVRGTARDKVPADSISSTAIPNSTRSRGGDGDSCCITERGSKSRKNEKLTKTNFMERGNEVEGGSKRKSEKKKRKEQYQL